MAGNLRVAQAVARRDADAIAAVARRQAALGADWLDVCAAGLSDESDALQWLVQIVQAATDVPLSLDTHDSDALRRALPLCRRSPLINSISLTQSEATWALLRDWTHCSVVALCLGEDGPKATVNGRLVVAARLADRLSDCGGLPERIVFDPLTLPAANGPDARWVTLHTMTALREQFPASRILCAVGNYGYGLPTQRRRAAERDYAEASLRAGADALLCDPALAARLGDAASDVVGDKVGDLGKGQ